MLSSRIVAGTLRNKGARMKAIGTAAVAAVAGGVAISVYLVPGLFSGLGSLARGGKGEPIPIEQTGLESLRGKVVLITGPNTGLGLETVRRLAPARPRLVFACRPGAPKEKLAEFESSVLATFDVDLADTRSIRSFVPRYKAAGLPPVDVLILNAGVISGRGETTAQGVELTVGVNYLGSWLFTNELLGSGLFPSKSDAGWVPRVIAIASEGHRLARKIDPTRILKPMFFAETYGWSKALLLSFMNELQRRLKGRAVCFAVCPGVMNTGLADQLPAIGRISVAMCKGTMARKPSDVAKEVAALAACQPPATFLAGDTSRCTYFNSGRADTPREDTIDKSIGERLWQSTSDLVRRIESGNGPLAASL